MDDIKEVRIQHLKKIIEDTGLSQTQFGFKLTNKYGGTVKPSNISNYCTGKREVGDTLASQIINAFPEKHYRRAYILGLDEYMTEAEFLAVFDNKTTINHNDRVTINASVFRQLAILNGFEVVLYDSGVYVDENGMYLDRYLVRNGEETRLMNYQEIADFIEYLSALTVHRINKLFKE